jgi:hypothetical protein
MLLKTIGLFLLNKVLEAWYVVLQYFVFMIALFILLIICFDVIGFISIAFIDGVGLHKFAYFLLITVNTNDGRLINIWTLGLFTGTMVFVIAALCAMVGQLFKDSRTTRFIKNNWEMAKAGKIYHPDNN